MTSFGSLKQSILEKFIDLVKRYVGWKIIAISVVAALGIGGNFLVTYGFTRETTSEIRNLIVSGVHNQTELTTASTNVTATIVIQESTKFLRFPTGEIDLVYEGVGTVRSDLDLSQLKVMDLDSEHHSVHILLPPPTISDVNLDVSRSSILADYRKWFGAKAGASIYEEAQRQAIAKMKQQACANGILKAANANAAQLVKGLLSEVNFENVVVKTQEPSTDSCPVQAA